MWCQRALLAVMCLGAALPACADTLQTYTLSGEESVGVPGYVDFTNVAPLTGTLTYDPSDQGFSADFGWGATYGQLEDGYFSYQDDLGYNGLSLALTMGGQSQILGGSFSAFTLVPYYYVDGEAVARYEYDFNGTVNAPTPELPGIALLATGCLALAALQRKPIVSPSR